MPPSTAAATVLPRADDASPLVRHEAWCHRAWLALLLALGACGGGSAGDGTPAAGTAPVPVLAAAPVVVVGATAVQAPAAGDAAGEPVQAASAPAALPPDVAPEPAAAAASAAPEFGPAQLAVLIAEGDATSEAIGLAYQRARGVPDANLIRVPVATGQAALSANDFVALKARVDALLPAGVQATLVTWTAPSRVQGPTCAMGITSALAFGWDTRFCGACNRTQASAYFDSRTRQPWTDLRIRLSMMLGAATLAEAQALIARGVAADGHMAAGASASGWLLRTADAARSVRWPDLQALAATPVPGVRWTYQDNIGGNVVSGQSDVMFYFTGLSRVPQLASNLYLPGAVGDHLTSFAGRLPDANGQMPATDWLAAGLTGSFGTVEEPCNYTQKFPQASVLVDHYRRGETLIEAYWKSVQWPGQGLFVGEPLARPWAAL